MAELCDVYDVNCKRTGEVFVRGDHLKDGQFQLVTNIWIINSSYKILIQKRSPFKRSAPNMWATHGGCVKCGETSLQACIREAYEEVGIVIRPKDVRKLARTTGKKLFVDNFITVQDFDISKAVLQMEEVSEIKWVTVKELKTMVNNNEFYKYPELPYLFNYINIIGN